MAARRENRVRLPLEVFAAVRRRGRQEIRRRLPLSRRGMHRGRQRRRATRSFRRRLRARRHGFPLDFARRQVRRRQAAGGRRGRLSLYRAAAATNACRNIISDATRPVRPQRRADRGDPQGGPRGGHRRCRSSAPAASTISRWPRTIWRAASATSSARRANRSPIPTGSARSLLGFGGDGAGLRIHQLLRGARPEAQAGDLPTVGQAPPRQANGARVTASAASPRRRGVRRISFRNDEALTAH